MLNENSQEKRRRRNERENGEKKQNKKTGTGKKSMSLCTGFFSVDETFGQISLIGDKETHFFYSHSSGFFSS